MVIEKWIDVEGFEGYYQVSNLGRVKSLERIRVTGNIKGIRNEMILKPYYNKGYQMVVLQKNKEKKYCYIHRLVAEAFIPNLNDLPFINHKDENKSNNIVSNLEWCTHKYNVNYGIGQQRRINNTDYSKNGKTTKQKYGKKIKGTNVSTGEILYFESLKDAERMLKIDNRSISKCCKGVKGHYTAGGYYWEFIEKDGED